MAEIDQTFYHGSDLYSDGDEAENTLLQIVQAGRGFYDLDQMSWPTFYHLNPIRENICNWYPFEKGARVLEIGAGCGGVTGALCGKGLQVYSIDLSLRRSTINYERHKDAENLHLVVGNLNDITFSEPFDYILLIGVLEYAGRFTEGEKPYQQFLENIRKWLRPEGKLLIAIENRLGLKYFSGAGEDHLGKPFAGLKDYPEDRGVRTFSRREMEQLLKRSGFQGYRFYYPYPDYKLPQEIFTDSTIKSRHYGKPYPVFDMDRADIFPETDMAEILREEGAAGAFANSYLAETCIAPEALSRRQVYYAKLNKGRRKAFQTGTKIYGEGEPTQVSRFALTAEADGHIRRITANEHRLAQERNVLQGSPQDGPEILYPYLTGKTLEDELYEAILNQDKEGAVRVFQQIRELAAVKPVQKSYESEPFTAWFGEARIAERKPECTETANVDLTPDNIFLEQDQPILSDCEWVTDFAVPVSFLIWRSAEKAYENHPRLQKVLAKEELWSIQNIPGQNIHVYQEWSRHFEYRYVSEKDPACFARTRELTNFYPAMDRARIEQLELRERELSEEVSRQKAQTEELAQTAKQQQEKAQQLQKDLEDLLSSRSWRMTAVFRAFRQKIFERHQDK